MWIWITGLIVAYLALAVLVFALLSATRMGRSDLPAREIEPEAEPAAAETATTASGETAVEETIGVDT
jgi:hypothetical protein